MTERFGDYELIEKIAVGGMAELYKAKSVHGQGIEKIVVIKRIHPALSADKSFVAMFVDEARLGVSLVHGNIVPVFDFGHIDGHYYLAMEHVNGHDLTVLNGRAKIVQHPWPEDLAIYLVKELLRGLEYAHNKRDNQGRPLKLVHRDISPSNVLVSSDGEVKILDFGIAHSMSREFETRTGVVKGKPGYMSPEQAAGQPVDRRSDIWSTGAILYELLAGTRLKDGRNPLGDPLLDPIIDRALAANPEARYESAEAFSAALDDVLHARKWRPTPSAAAAFVADVMGAAAPSTDWTMSSDDAGDHMAAALKVSNVPLPATARFDRPDHDNLTPPAIVGTVQLPVNGKKRLRRRLATLVASLIAVSGLTAAWWFLDQNTMLESTGVESSAATSPPVAPTPSQPATGTIKFACQPEGATIAIDGQTSDHSCPATLTLAVGSYDFTLSHPGFEPRTLNESVEASSTLRVNLELQPARPTVSVESDPIGAQVEIDGATKGKTPLSQFEVSPGDHTARLTLAGFKSWEQAFSPGAGEHVELKATLSKLPQRPPAVKTEPALLSINSRPWAEVRIDGQVIGNTPIISHAIAPGRYRVELSNPVRQSSKTLHISLAPGEHKKIKELLTDDAP